jgi:hypothetical protein
MSEPDAVPLPREGEVFFDVRGESRTMRLSWYADSSVAVFSIWQGNRCTSTFRLPFGDLARMVETLEAGPPSRGPDRHPGEPSYANAGSDPGYGYPEPGGYGDQATYAGAPGYGSGSPYGTGRDYPPAEASGQYYGDYERPAAGPGYRSGEGHGEPDEYYAPRYVPDVAPAVRYQPGYQGEYARPAVYSQRPEYAQAPDYARPPEYAGPHGYPDSEHGRYQQPQQYRGEPGAAYRAETQFLAAPQGQHGAYPEGPPTRAWREDQHGQADEDALSGYAHSAKTEQGTTDWGPATASYRAR